MSKRKPKKRDYRIINFKAYFDTDEDILDWWEGIEAGERSDALRDLIRDHLGLPSPPRRMKVVELPELLEVRRDTLWIRDALNEMPGYLERVIQHVAANVQPVMPEHVPEVVAQPATRGLSEAEGERRARRMKRVGW